MREMVGGLYQPVWGDVTLVDGQIVRAIIFTAQPQHIFYENNSSPDTVIRYISTACGNLGRNRDYVLHLEQSLRRYGIVDEYIHELAGRLKAEVSSD